MEAELAVRFFPPYASFAVYDHAARITRTLSNSQYNFQSRETEAQTAPNQAWEMRSGMHCRGTFRMIEPPVIPPGSLNILQMNVEVSWAPAFMNARADLPPNFILCSLRPRRGGNWVESRNPPPPFNWAIPAGARIVPQPNHLNHEGEEENNHQREEEEEEREENAEQSHEEVEVDNDQENGPHEAEVVVVEDDSHEEGEGEASEDRNDVRPGEYYGERQESEAEENPLGGEESYEGREFREEYREEGEETEEVTIVEEITEEQIFAPFRTGNIPFAVFGQDGVVANPEDFILVESDESPIVNYGFISEPTVSGVDMNHKDSTSEWWESGVWWRRLYCVIL